jgi:hypothetical protein
MLVSLTPTAVYVGTFCKNSNPRTFPTCQYQNIVTFTTSVWNTLGVLMRFVTHPVTGSFVDNLRLASSLHFLWLYFIWFSVKNWSIVSPAGWAVSDLFWNFVA